MNFGTECDRAICTAAGLPRSRSRTITLLSAAIERERRDSVTWVTLAEILSERLLAAGRSDISPDTLRGLYGRAKRSGGIVEASTAPGADTPREAVVTPPAQSEPRARADPVRPRVVEPPQGGLPEGQDIASMLEAFRRI